MKSIVLGFFLVGTWALTSAQEFVDSCHQCVLSIQNVEIQKDAVDFDLFIRSSKKKESHCGVVYLGFSDFVITYNQEAFRDVSFTKLGDSSKGGTCTLEPVDKSGLNETLTRINYFNGIIPRALQGNLIINLVPPAPNDAKIFQTNIAAIDDRPDQHRLGRFRVLGYKGSGDPQLQVATGEKSSPKTSDGLTRKDMQTRVYCFAGEGEKIMSYAVGTKTEKRHHR